MKKYLFLFLSLSMFMFSVLGTSVENSEAFFACGGTLGPGFAEKSVNIPSGKMILPTTGSRVYTVDELFSNAYRFATPYGLVNGPEGFRAENTRITDIITDLDAGQKGYLENQGKAGAFECSTYGFKNDFAFLAIGLAQFFSNIIKFFTASLFNDNLICKPTSPQGYCIDLLGIIGGHNKGERSLINTFSNGIFYPLSGIVFALTAVYLLWAGGVKREFRVSINGFLWAFFAFGLGVAVAVNPHIVARGPQTINTAIADCILDAISGQSCTASPIAQGTNDVPSVCLSSANGADSSTDIQLKINSMSCSIVKGFTLDTWSLEQFGYTIDELWTVNAPDGFTVYDRIHGDAEDYCVYMGSESAPSEMTGSTAPYFDTARRCNIALAYLAAQTTGDYGTNLTSTDSSTLMGKIIATAAKDDRMWAAFSGSSREIFNFPLILSVIVAAIAFVPVTIYAHAYSFTGTVMMAFAPIFLLFAIHPGKGRKIFLGWFEAVVGSILKYMASALLVLIMLTTFSAVLSKTRGLLMFVATVVLTVTFIMYRKDLVNLIGATNMGGMKVANRAADKLNSTLDRTSMFASGAVGGAVGHALANAKSGESIAKGLATGALSGVKNEMSRGRGFTAQATRTFNSVNDKNDKARADQVKEEKANVQREEQQNKTKEAMKEVVQQVDQKELENTKNNFNGDEKVQKSIEDSKSAGLTNMMKELQEGANKVNASETNKEANVAKTEFNAKAEVVNNLSGHLLKNNNDVEKGLNSFSNEHTTKNEMLITNKLNELQNIANEIKNSNPDKSKEIESFISNEYNKMNQNSDNFKHKINSMSTELDTISVNNVSSTLDDLQRQATNQINQINQFKEQVSKQVVKKKAKSINDDLDYDYDF